jgi:hypothetical protein
MKAETLKDTAVYYIHVKHGRQHESCESVTWAGHVAQTGEMRNAHKILVRKCEGKRPFRTPIHRWEANIS